MDRRTRPGLSPPLSPGQRQPLLLSGRLLNKGTIMAAKEVARLPTGPVREDPWRVIGCDGPRGP